jgi:hypothetical protein
MNSRPESHYLKYAAVFCMVLGCAAAAHAQSFRAEATLHPNYFLVLPALKVGDKFYEAGLDYRASTWTLAYSVQVPPVDSDYMTGSYENGVVELPCVNFNGSVYSARLTSTSAGTYSFTLASSTKLASCPRPAGIGPIRGQWERTAESPLSARNLAALAWTGTEILVLGGMEYFCPATASCIGPSTPPFRDGAAYNPLTNTWRRIADAPAAVAGGAATAGSDVFVFARTNFTTPYILLRYRTAQDQWQEVPLPPGTAGSGIASFRNSIVLHASQTDQNGVAVDWLLDTVTHQWTQLPAAPLGPGFDRKYVAFGEDLYLFDHALVPSPGGASGPSYLRAARLRGQQWQLLPIADSIGTAPSLVSGQRLIAPALGCADGGQVNNYGRCIPFGAVFDTTTDTWRELPNAPGRGLKDFKSSGGFTDSALVLLETGHPALDANTNAWSIVPVLDTDTNTQRSMAGVGPYGFAFGGVSASGQLLKDSWIWRP